MTIEKEVTRRVVPTRRSALGLSAAAMVAGLLPKKARAWASGAEVIDVTTSPYNASPGNADNTTAFQSALNTLAALGGGTLIVPPGNYVFTNSSGLTYSGASLSIIGSGQELSVLYIHHTGTALTVTTTNIVQSVTIRDIGFCAPANSAASGAIALNFPSVTVSGWPSCVIENVDFGVNSSGYFAIGLLLTNAWRSTVRGCNYHAPGAPEADGTFLQFSGFCVDCRVTNCNIDQANRGILVASYMEGLHVNDCVIIANGTTTGNGISTGSTNYNNGVNLLELFVDNCEFNCSGPAISLYQVNTAFIANSHIGSTNGTPGGSNFTAALYACQAVQFSNCQISGTASTSTPQLGFYIGANAGGSPCVGTEFNNLTFQNISTGIVLAYSITATGRENRLFAPGFASLVGAPTTYGTVLWEAVDDFTGNTTNEIEWVSSNGLAANHTTDRLLYTQTQ